MGSKAAAGWRRPGTLRSTLQQAQQTSDLAQAVLRLPPLHRSKPLLLALQLQPLPLLLEARGPSNGGSRVNGSDSSNDSDTGEEDEGGSLAAAAAAAEEEGPNESSGPSTASIAAAAKHLRRLTAVDGQAAANESLLFWMLLALVQRGGQESGRAAAAAAAAAGGGGQSGAQAGRLASGQADMAVWLRWRLEPGPFLLLVEAMGWEDLLGLALAHAGPALAQDLLQHCPKCLPASSAAGASLHSLLLAELAGDAARRLEEGQCGASAATSSAGAGHAHELAELDPLAAGLAPALELLQQHLLAWQAAGGSNGVVSAQAASLQRLAGAIDARMPALLALTRHPGWEPHHQHLFQQLCQLRARLALLMAAGTAQQGSGGSSSGAADPGQTPSAEWGGPGMPPGSAADVWCAVLELQQPSSGATVSGVAGSRAAVGQPGSAGTPSLGLLLFLAAQVAASTLFAVDTAAEMEAGTLATGSPDAATALALGAQRQLQPQPGFTTHIAALPGIIFLAPPLPTPAGLAPPAPTPVQTRAGGTLPSWHRRQEQQGWAAPASGLQPQQQPVIEPLEREPDPLSPARLALAALQLAQQLQRGSQRGAGSQAAVRSLLWLAQGAASRVDSRWQQRALLKCVLSGEQLAGLRGTLEGDEEVQEWSRQGLVALSNRMAEDESTVTVFGDERQRVATLVREVLPFGLLAPAAAVERLVVDALSHAGQAGVIVEALAEMAPLAFFSGPGAAPAGTTHLAGCLAACLAGPAEEVGRLPRAAGAPAAFQTFSPPDLSDSPAARRAFLSLAAQLCSARAAAGGRPLVAPAALLCCAVLPALQPQPPAHQAAASKPHPALTLALELACALLGCQGTGQTAPSSSLLPDAASPQLAELLLGMDGTAGQVHPSDSNGGGSLAVQLLGPLLALLDFPTSRQLSLSSAPLLIPLEGFDLAAGLVQHIVLLLQAALLGGNGSIGSAAAAAEAAAGALAARSAALPDAWLRLWPLRAVSTASGRSTATMEMPPTLPPLPGSGEAAAVRLLQLCAAHEPVARWAASQLAGSQLSQEQLDDPALAQASRLLTAVGQLPLPEARRVLVAACASLLPVCTPFEAERVLGGGLPLAVAAVAVGPPGQLGQQAALQAAALEVVCRALHTLALAPASCPIAGEAAAPSASGEESSSEGEQQGPSALRRVAVERAMRHVSAHCQLITAPSAAGTAAAAAAAAEPEAVLPALQPCSAGMEGGTPAGLAVRCFQEVCRVAAAVQPFYACTTLQVCLIHLTQVIQRCEGGALSEERAAVLLDWASRLQGSLGQTLCYALEPADG